MHRGGEGLLNFSLDNLRGGSEKSRDLILYNFKLKIYKGQVGLLPPLGMHQDLSVSL
jgi:hypothetical protein